MEKKGRAVLVDLEKNDTKPLFRVAVRSDSEQGLLGLAFHEFCHAWAAYQLGDDTAKRQGRLLLSDWEDYVFFDGRAHKFDRVTFHIPEGTFDGAPWSFTSNDGRFEMTFKPIIDRHSAVDLKLLRSVQHQVFGRFSGTAVLDDGRRIRHHDGADRGPAENDELRDLDEHGNFAVVHHIASEHAPEDD